MLVTHVTAQGRNLGITKGKNGKRKIYQLLKIYFGIVLTQELWSKNSFDGSTKGVRLMIARKYIITKK